MTFEDDDLGLRHRDVIGVNNLLWGNDYPHHDSIWPNSRAVIKRIFADVPEDEVTSHDDGQRRRAVRHRPSISSRRSGIGAQLNAADRRGAATVADEVRYQTRRPDRGHRAQSSPGT